MDNDKFWKSIERFKLSIELVTALLVTIPIIYAFIAQGLTATMPAWAVLIISVFAISLGYILGRNSIKRTESVPKLDKIPSRTLLHTIDFKYQDSPTNHNWTINCTDDNQPTITHIQDGFEGNTIQIESTASYAMDIPVEPVAQLGKRIEIVAKVQKGYGLYSFASYISKDGSTRKNVWFNYQIGVEEPRPFNADKSEWIVYMKPELINGNWYKFDIDLQRVIERSIGKEGWSFRKLRSFRIRGNVQIARINIYQ